MCLYSSRECDSGDKERDSCAALQWWCGGDCQRLLKSVALAPRSNSDLTTDLSLQLINVKRHGPFDEKTWLFERV